MRRAAVLLLLMFSFTLYMAAQQTGSTGATEPNSSQSGAQSDTGAQPSSGSQSDTGAQTSSGAMDHSGMASSSAKKGNSIEGCLQSASSGSDSYTLKTKDQGDVQVQASGKLKNEISKHVGHEVRLVGSWANGGASGSSAMSETTPSSSQSASSETGAASSSANAGETQTAQNTQSGSSLPQSDQPMASGSSASGTSSGQFKANRLDMIAESCTAGAQ